MSALGNIFNNVWPAVASIAFAGRPTVSKFCDGPKNEVSLTWFAIIQKKSSKKIKQSI
jgi:hypothetical protein